MTKDFNQLAKSIVGKATKNAAAVELGRRGGKIGGKARAEKLSPERRKEISQKASAARWPKKNT